MVADDMSVFIVDDDGAVRDSLALLLGVHGYRTALFADAQSFLKALRPDWRGCLLLDIRMPGMDGLTLQKHLLDAGCTLPVIVMTGHGSIGAARDAFRSRAVDFLEKPLDNPKLLVALKDACGRYAEAQGEADRQAAFARLFEDLTPREKQVMELVVTGRHNREIAEDLGISSRTVEVHKARVMQKLMVDSLAQLVRLSVGLSDKRHH